MRFTYVEPKKFEVSEGLHTVVIRGAELVKSKALNDMLKLTFFVPSSNKVPCVHYIVESEKRDQNGDRYFDRNLSRFYDAFGIPPDCDPNNAMLRQGWLNRSALAMFKMETDSYYDASGNLKQTTGVKIQWFQKNDATEQGANAGAPTPPNSGAAKPTVTNSEGFPEDIPF